MSAVSRKAIFSLAKIALCITALLAVLCFCGTAFALVEEGSPDEGTAGETNVKPWHEITLTPGQTYDVGTAKSNTTVHIAEAGTYYLTGSSSKCRVLIESGGVDLYLKDGLKIDPGSEAYVGSATAAITVGDQGGTVRLISEKNANITFGGYLECPAIRKHGVNTKLIFETEDPANPGTITAKRSKSSLSAGIGGAAHYNNTRIGNMEFKSGIIYATGGTHAAGIGCAKGNSKAVDIIFSGAEVHAQGYGYGAGIGGGMYSAADGITVTGGKVYAIGDKGAGIGGGAGDSQATATSGTVTVSGGYVEASSNWGAGIGAGREANIKKIVIEGGTVYATTNRGAAIGGGSGGNHFHGLCKQIIITGGTVIATSTESDYGIGIGCADVSNGTGTVDISGGYIEATGDEYSIGGGGVNSKVSVNISGGTVICKPVLKGYIGGKSSNFTCTVTGGSLRASAKCTVTDGNGNTLTQMNICLKGCPEKTKVTEATYIGAGVDYGMKDIYTVDPDGTGSFVYPWLPYTSSTTEMTAEGIRYYGNALTSKGEDILYPATKLTLDKNAPSSETGAENGSAAAGQGQTAALDIIQAQRPGYTVKGYAADANGNTLVMNADGTLKPNCSGLTDSEGKWLPQSGTVTLYAVWEGNPFTVQFSANRPDSASTETEGSMVNQSFTSGKAQSLAKKRF